MLFFSAISDYCSTLYGTRPIPVVGNACCLTTYSGRESHTTLATGLAQMVGVDLNYQSTPALFASDPPEDTAEETVASPAGPLTQEAETDKGFSLKNWFYGLFASLLNRFR